MRDDVLAVEMNLASRKNQDIVFDIRMFVVSYSTQYQHQFAQFELCFSVAGVDIVVDVKDLIHPHECGIDHFFEEVTFIRAILVSSSTESCSAAG